MIDFHWLLLFSYLFLDIFCMEQLISHFDCAFFTYYRFSTESRSTELMPAWWTLSTSQQTLSRSLSTRLVACSLRKLCGAMRPLLSRDKASTVFILARLSCVTFKDLFTSTQQTRFPHVLLATNQLISYNCVDWKRLQMTEGDPPIGEASCTDLNFFTDMVWLYGVCQ